jgi:DNA-binding NarL/FixJ family response regulator
MTFTLLAAWPAQARGPLLRSSYMSAVDQRPANGAPTSGGLSSAIVIAKSAKMLARIEAALAEQEMASTQEIEAPAGICNLEVDESAIVIFVCDIDVPQQVTDLRRLCRDASKAAIVAISPPATGAGVRRALDAGADALVFDTELELTLAAAIHAVASGQTVVPRKLRASVERPTLSHREHQVIALVCQGLTNAEIAEQLYLAESTVKSHLASVFTKFGVHSRKEAAAVFADLELTSVGSAPPIGYEAAAEQAPA